MEVSVSRGQWKGMKYSADVRGLLGTQGAGWFKAALAPVAGSRGCGSAPGSLLRWFCVWPFGGRCNSSWVLVWSNPPTHLSALVALFWSRSNSCVGCALGRVYGWLRCCAARSFESWFQYWEHTGEKRMVLNMFFQFAFLPSLHMFMGTSDALIDTMNIRGKPLYI